MNNEKPKLVLKKPKNMYPTNHNFRLVPNFIPGLTKFIKKVKWNSVAKILEVKIIENSKFESFAWFGTINDRHKEGQKGSFFDLEQDTIRLYFLDGEEKEVSCFKFKNLKLLSHECVLDTLSEDDDSEFSDHICHQITIEYKDFKVLPIQEEDANDEINSNIQSVIDEEWQTMNPDGI